MDCDWMGHHQLVDCVDDICYLEKKEAENERNTRVRTVAGLEVKRR
jgi:hypothetical protein